ncbi:MAG: DUF554 family protein [Verrucomicrobiota bacterium]
MIGTVINAVAIVGGAALGGSRRGLISASRQQQIKSLLAVLTVGAGFMLIWRGLWGGFGMVLKELGIGLLAMVLGPLIGRWLHLQQLSNRAGEYARQRMAAAKPDAPGAFSDGLVTASLLFCTAPLSLLGALEDGLHGFWMLLVIKAVMDGMAAMTFTRIFGWGVRLSFLPVVAWQGFWTLGGAAIAQAWQAGYPAVLHSIHLAAGFICLSVAIVIFEVRKVELTDYLPSLVVAPLLTWWWL